MVVSEERGTISIAQQGELQVVGPEELPDRLQHCLGGSSSPTQLPLKSHLADLGTKLAAVMCAVTLWFLFAYQTDTIQRTFVVPIEYRNLPDGWEILNPKPTYAEITLSGSFSLHPQRARQKNGRKKMSALGYFSVSIFLSKFEGTRATEVTQVTRTR